MLAALGAEARTLHEETARLIAQRSALAQALARRQAALARVLVARQQFGAPDALRVALSGQPPADMARTLHYLALASQAAAQLVADVKRGIAELDELSAQLKRRAQRLAALETEQRARRGTLLAERRARKSVLGRVAGEIRATRRQMRVMRADESRLARLVEEIGRVIGPGAARDAGAQAPAASAAGPRAFSSLRGALALPVRGELLARFGAQRPGSATSSKGLFIRAGEGQPVRAVGAGQVVFADWMRGYGNLLIVDHGEEYLTIYANNEALLKQVGDIVAAGETVATVGASGGNEETGLYFELRRAGEVIDPMRWMARR